MKAIETLERKLNWWNRTKKKLVVATAALMCLSGITGIAYPYLSKNADKEIARKELVEDPVPEIDVTGIRNECIDDIVISGAYKKYEQIIQSVSKRTGVPKYVLASMIEDGYKCREGKGAMDYPYPGFITISEEEAGIKSRTLDNDPEQCLLSAAGKYKKILAEVQDEETALGVLFTNEESVKSAKKQARRYLAIMLRYEQWRKGCDPEKIKPYDELMEQINNEKDFEKREALVKKMTQKWDSFELGISRGALVDEQVYRVLTARKYHRIGQWWPEQLATGSVKVALRLKKDGYN